MCTNKLWLMLLSSTGMQHLWQQLLLVALPLPLPSDNIVIAVSFFASMRQESDLFAHSLSVLYVYSVSAALFTYSIYTYAYIYLFIYVCVCACSINCFINALWVLYFETKFRPLRIQSSGVSCLSRQFDKTTWGVEGFK